MHRTFLALTIAALAGFATAAHANDGAPARSTVAPHADQSRGRMILAEVIGKGVLGQPCHASQPNSNGGSDTINYGKYVETFGHLRCQSPAGGSIDCHKDDKSFPPKGTCIDGNGP